MINLELTVNKDLLPEFNILLQQGFFIKTEVGVSVRDLLKNECHRDGDYIESRIKTIFLNSKAVDDIDMAIIKEKSTLSICGAMPGLVGALMRSGSPMSSMRSSITYKEDISKLPEPGTGMVKMKLFNLILEDLGHDFLTGGIYFLSVDLREFFSDNKNLITGCRDIKINDELLTIDSFRDKISKYKEKYIFIKINL